MAAGTRGPKRVSSRVDRERERMDLGGESVADDQAAKENVPPPKSVEEVGDVDDFDSE